jgi:hypothetical protein
LPRCGGGARKGESVSTSNRSNGTVRATAWISAERGKQTIPENEMKKPRASARRASSSPPVKQWITPPTSRGAFLFQDAGGLAVGLPGVDDERKAHVAGQADLLAERRALHVAGRVVIVEVEPDLADGPDPPFASQAAQLVSHRWRVESSLMRMGAGGSRKPEAFGHPQRPPVPRLLVDAPDDQHVDHASRPGPRHHRLPIGIELRHVDVAMAVDHRRCRLSHDFQSYIPAYSML